MSTIKSDFNQNIFEKIILDFNMHTLICEFLTIKSTKSLFLTNKKIYKDDITRKYYYFILINKAKKIIFNFFKKIKNTLKIINNTTYNSLIYDNKIPTRIFLAYYYFKYYPKRHINELYNMNCIWKKAIIDKYKKKETNNPTRFDLFNLIRKIPVNDVFSIGW